MRLPDFLIIGAQKAGTTWLAEQLRAHSGIFMPSGELHFFDQREPAIHGTEWYAAQFAPAGDRRAGEKTPNYLFLPDNPDIRGGHLRLARLLPNARLIAILRDPVDRAVSAVHHMQRKGIVSPRYSIDALLGPRCDLLSWHVLEVGLYAGQVEAYMSLYDREQLLVLFFDEIQAAPAAVVERVCRFLDLAVESDDRWMKRRANSSRPTRLRMLVDYYFPRFRKWTHRLDRYARPYYPVPSDATRRRLYDYYEAHNERLFELLGRRPRSGWRYAPGAEAS